jgi:hypothetical protein
MCKPLCVWFGVGLVLALTGPVRADDQGETRALVDKAIKALGGKDKLARFKAATWKAKGTLYGNEEVSFEAEWTVQGPEKHRIEADAEANGQKFKVFIVLNGDMGWFKLADNSEDLNKDRLTEEKERAYLDWLTTFLPLQDKGLKLSPLGEMKIDDRPAVGLTVSSKDHREVNLYFDKEKGLLLKSETRVKDVDRGVEVGQEILYSDFKEIDGVPRPTKVSYKRDGQRYIEMEISEFKLLEKADDSLFSMP